MLQGIKIPNEPQIVFDIRSKILDEFKDLVFIEDGHKYFLNGQSLPSVSEVTHHFQMPFDTQQQATRYAEKHGETPQYWMDKWRYKSLLATTTGTLVHSYGESLGWLRNCHPELITEENKCKYIKDKDWLIPTRPKEEAILKFYDEFPKDLHFVLAETKVYSNKSEPSMCAQQFCGTFDLLGYYKNPKPQGKSGLVVLDYKGLPLDTPIFTTEGWKTMGDLKEGDKVFDEDGKSTTVLHKSEVHHNPCYKIYFTNGDSIVADCDHRWKVLVEDTERVMTTQELETYISNCDKYSQHPKIKAAKPIEAEYYDFPIDPYVYGVYIGLIIGDLSKALPDDVMAECVKRRIEVWTMEELDNTVDELAKISNPEGMPMLCGSVTQRLRILNGIMDVVGEYDRLIDSYIVNLDTNNDGYYDYLYSLLSSLGIDVYTVEGLRHIVFECGFNPFLARKEEGPKAPATMEQSYKGIVQIEKVDTVPTCCIEVDSPRHTFCAGKGFIVTHNTNAELTKPYSREHGKMLLPPFTDMWDEPLSLYTLQLSCYALCLRGIGLDVIGLRIIWLKDDGTYELIPLRDLSKEDYFKEAL